MKTLPLVHNPSDVLRTPGNKITLPPTQEIRDLIPLMINTMHKANGVGLASQQIGKALQLCVIQVDKNIYIMINPKITAHSKETEVDQEGCLSIPGKFYPIERSEFVKVRYIDEYGETKKLRARGLLARAVQHELDHLNGKLIIDYL